RLGRVQDQARAGQGGDRQRAAVDPEQRRPGRRGELQEDQAMEDRGDDEQVLHAAEQVEAERRQQQRVGGGGQERREQRRQDRQRLGGDRGEQPAAAERLGHVALGGAD